MLYIRPCKVTYLNVINLDIYQYGMQTWVAATWTEVLDAQCGLLYVKKETATGKSYMNVYGIVKKYYSHVSKRKTPRVDAAATKLYSVMTWDAKLVTSWEL